MLPSVPRVGGTLCFGVVCFDQPALGPTLTRDEIPTCLTHRLRRAGTELGLFEPAAYEALFQATGGLPRKLNGLAHHALLAAALARAKTVSADHVQAALPEVS